MAIKTIVKTQYGEDREMYIRLNNVESSNHGAVTYALFRGFLSRSAFEEGAHYMWEQSVEFVADVSQPLWEQGYAALKDQLGVECVDC